MLELLDTKASQKKHMSKQKKKIVLKLKILHFLSWLTIDIKHFRKEMHFWI